MNTFNVQLTWMKLKSRFSLTAVLLVLFVFILFYLNQTQIEYQIGYDEKEINLNELFHIGSCLLKQAGKNIVKIRSEKSDLDLNRKKSDNSIVTQADLESHTMLVHTLQHKYKNLKIISEENTQSNQNFNPLNYLKTCDNYKPNITNKFARLNEISVWIDPLDATQEYSGYFGFCHLIFSYNLNDYKNNRKFD